MKEINNIRSIGILSDSHIPTRAKEIPKSVFEMFKNTDLIIHCGDIITQDIIIELNEIAPTYSVKGNMDPDDITFPTELILKINERFVFCISHGNGDPFSLKHRLYKKFQIYKPDIIIFGHSHISENSKYNNVIMFNPGSCTQGLNGNSVGIINIKDDGFVGEIRKI
ncbi:MAG: YfcE family phosphodiesterase [Candidatus Goldbacteria bacterium]|nr:YfcE family phosphodiesterase [Candidatus Goldiibacteriota bacterium]